MGRLPDGLGAADGWISAAALLEPGERREWLVVTKLDF